MTSDADAAIGHAHEVQEETVDRLDEARERSDVPIEHRLVTR
ncbi:MAG TPA: hypothetical protein VNT32_05025 [Thermoleophilaceae bacterium]|nr:hypothetical protein [Thermoleophilaceae bacterium]